jgi:hypothetical protein
MPRSRANGCKLFLHVAKRFTSARQGQSLPDPLRDRHAAGARHALNLPVFGILQNHLQSLSHIMSITDSSS